MNRAPAPEILATTDRWRVVNKPPDWVVIPGRGPQPDVRSWLERETGEGIWVVHRIDRGTSGLVLFARTAEAHREACRWFESHQVSKRYDLLAVGEPRLPIFKVAEPIGAARAVTQVEVKRRFTGFFLAQAVPLTGRRHQIRIHLSGRGHPLLGDVEYGGPADAEGIAIGRVALHAARLELPGGERFSAPWPEDFTAWVEALR